MAPVRPLAAPRFVKPDDSDTWHEAGEAEKNVILAALAIIRIEPVAGIPPGEFDELKAQVTFHDSAGGELQRVYHGCWLGDALNHMQLSASGTAELIVAVDHPSAVAPFVIKNTRSNAALYEYEGIQLRQLERRLYDVNVRFIGDSR